MKAPRHKKLGTGQFALDAKKSLGQNFLNNEGIIQKIVNAASAVYPNEEHLVCHEVGPGPGTLTKLLLKANWKVLALDLDPRAVQGLQSTLAEEYSESFSIIEQDVLKWEPQDNYPAGTRLCIGNLPYYITSDILLWFIAQRAHYCAGLFMVQNEVADRIVSLPSTKSYGRLSVLLQLCFEVKKLFMVKRNHFTPAPKVDSAIIQLVPKEFPFSSNEQFILFQNFTAALFSARRKMVFKTINNWVEKQGLPEWGWQGFDELKKLRPDAIPPQQVLQAFLAATKA